MASTITMHEPTRDGWGFLVMVTLDGADGAAFGGAWRNSARAREKAARRTGRFVQLKALSVSNKKGRNSDKHCCQAGPRSRTAAGIARLGAAAAVTPPPAERASAPGKNPRANVGPAGSRGSVAATPKASAPVLPGRAGVLPALPGCRGSSDRS